MLRVRLASGVVIITIIGLAFAFGGYFLAGILLLISLIGYTELVKALACEKKHKINGLDIIAYVSIVLYYAAAVFTKGHTYLFLALGAFVTAEMIWFVLRFPVYSNARLAGSMFSVLYGPVLLSFIYLLRCLDGVEFLVWMVMISSWGCDSLAYVAGKLLGRHHPFPKLSPKKTTEGCIGGVLGSALIGLLFGLLYVKRFIPDAFVEWKLALICGVGGLMGIVGDLAASGIKRNSGIKDFSRLIPGHGGMIDRFDSMMLCAATVYILTYLIIF